MPQPRQLSAFDPEWEEDPQFVAQTRKAAMAQAASKKLPSPAVLSDILSELTERQRSQERVRLLARPADCSAHAQAVQLCLTRVGCHSRSHIRRSRPQQARPVRRAPGPIRHMPTVHQ